MITVFCHVPRTSGSSLWSFFNNILYSSSHLETIDLYDLTRKEFNDLTSVSQVTSISAPPQENESRLSLGPKSELALLKLADAFSGASRHATQTIKDLMVCKDGEDFKDIIIHHHCPCKPLSNVFTPNDHMLFTLRSPLHSYSSVLRLYKHITQKSSADMDALMFHFWLPDHVRMMLEMPKSPTASGKDLMTYALRLCPQLLSYQLRWVASCLLDDLPNSASLLWREPVYSIFTSLLSLLKKRRSSISFLYLDDQRGDHRFLKGFSACGHLFPDAIKLSPLLPRYDQSTGSETSSALFLSESEITEMSSQHRLEFELMQEFLSYLDS